MNAADIDDAAEFNPPDHAASRIQPWRRDPRYWQYHGKPILLIGASNEDNLFNHPDLPPDGLAAHLDRMRGVGGNYVRNTMSSRDPGNLWPHWRDAGSGQYDLRRFDAAYWKRFADFLGMTAVRGIIVQIEVWDRFDYAREPWDANPFNPRNNVNYTAAVSGLPEVIATHPGQLENPFFRAIPELEDNELLLPYQRALVRKMLEISLPHDHVLYCVSNETNDSEAWSAYWAGFIRAEARARGLGVELTEMWDAHDLRDPMHARTFDHPERYSFVDVSQNSHQRGQAQWDNLQAIRQRLSARPRPVNSVKMYGGKHGGGPTEGQHKLWRHILGGGAAARYHRPGGGMGLNDVTAAHLKSLSMALEDVDIFTLEPANGLLAQCGSDQAYLAARPGRQYLLYLPHGDPVDLDLRDTEGAFRLRWLNVLAAHWDKYMKVVAGDMVALTPPRAGGVAQDGGGNAPWVAVLMR